MADGGRRVAVLLVPGAGPPVQVWYGAILTLLLFAFVVRRLIGVRVPVPRTLAAGLVAVLVFSPSVTAMIGGPGFPRKGSVLPACGS